MKTTTRPGSLLLFVAIILSISACSAKSTPTSQRLPTLESPIASLIAPDQVKEYNLPTIQDGQINVREVTGFSDEFNTWYVYGLISNDTDQTVTDVVIEVELIDAIGKVLYANTTNPAINNLAVGETSPFTLYTYEALSDVETIGLSILSRSPKVIDRADLQFEGITVWHDTVFNDVYISGNITNSTPDPVLINGIAASLHSESGALISANSAYPFLYYLDQGISAPFRVMLDVPEDEDISLTNYKLYLDAEFTSPANILNLITSQEHYGYLDVYDKFHLVGLLTNNTESHLNVRLVAGIFDDGGNCLDAASLFLPVAVNPGESIPYDFDLWGALDSAQDAYKTATQYEIYVDWYSTGEAFSTPIKITTTEDGNNFDGYSITFTGNVLNNSGRILDGATVIIALFDRTTEELIATDYSYLSGPIEIDGLVPYTVNIYPEAEFDPTNIEFSITTFGQ